MDTCASRIVIARKEKGYTIGELAKRCNLTYRTIYKIEFGSTPSLDTLNALSKVLEKPIWYLGKFEDMPTELIGQKLKKARYYEAKSKIEFSKDLGVEFKTLTSWEKGVIPSKKFLPIIYKKIAIIDSSK